MSIGCPSNAKADTSDCWHQLANAVIVQAAADYRQSVRKLRKNSNDYASRKKQKDIENFFHSGWLTTLTNASGDYILCRLRREAASENSKSAKPCEQVHW